MKFHILICFLPWLVLKTSNYYSILAFLFEFELNQFGFVLILRCISTYCMLFYKLVSVQIGRVQVFSRKHRSFSMHAHHIRVCRPCRWSFSSVRMEWPVESLAQRNVRANHRFEKDQSEFKSFAGCWRFFELN